MHDAGNTELTAEGLDLIADERIQSDVALVGSLVERLLTRLSGALPSGRRANIDLALREAIVNAMVHGNQRDPEKRVCVTVARNGDGEIFAIVRDEGQGFDYERLRTPLQGDRLYASGGRGVFLMRSLTKDLTFLDDGRAVRLQLV